MSLFKSAGALVADCSTRAMMGAVATVLAAVLALGGCSTVEEAASLPSTGESAQAEELTSGALSFTLEDADGVFSEEADGGIVVLVEGTDDAGNPVSKQYVAVVGQKYNTDLGPGKYTVSLADRPASKGENRFKSDSYNASFDGKSDCDAVLRISLDEEAIAKAEAAKREAEEKAAEEKAAAEKAAAEEAAKKEAEEKAAAEAAAKKEVEEKAAAEVKAAEEKAAAEAAAAREAEEKAKAEVQEEEKGATVYVASSGKGKKYHSNPDCSNMKGTKKLSESEAKAQGYTPCKKCY